MVNIYAPTAQDDISLEELELYHLITAYRTGLGLPEIPLSANLSATAGRHAIDSVENIWIAGVTLPPGANLHSWSDAPYYGDHRDPEVMWYAPERIGLEYPGLGFEISAAGYQTIEEALVGWQNSSGHDDVIVNAGSWANANWQSIGVGVEIRNDPGIQWWGNAYHVWFGREVDPDGPPTIRGTSSSDRIEATSFDDIVLAGAGDDTVETGSGNDYIDGGSGADDMNGGTGNDTYRVNSLADVITDASGNDRIIASSDYRLAAGVAIEWLQTNGASGTTDLDLYGNALSQEIWGNNGHNILSDGGGAADVLRGFGGNDLYVIRSLGTQVIETNGQGTDRIATTQDYVVAEGVDAEYLTTTAVRGRTDINLTGNNSNNEVYEERIYGNDGDNRLNGQDGRDILVGRGGTDVFVFDAAPGYWNMTRIRDFEIWVDLIELDGAVFGLAPGDLDPNAFRIVSSGKNALDASDRIIYNTETGYLFHDADGVGGAASDYFGRLDTAPNGLSDAYFYVV